MLVHDEDVRVPADERGVAHAGVEVDQDAHLLDVGARQVDGEGRLGFRSAQGAHGPDVAVQHAPVGEPDDGAGAAAD